ncbi:MAG: MFS transporter [Candidatus Methylacidiphilales bacterium]
MVYAASATITPICLVVLAREMHFGLGAAGSLELARSFLTVGTLLVSGLLAARLGKVRSLAVSCWLLGVGLAFYAVAPSYGWVVLALLLLGGAGGVLEALINPLVQETHPRDSGKFLSFVNAFWSLGVLLTMIAGGELLSAEVSWRWLVGGLAVFSILAGIGYAVLIGQDPGRKDVSIAEAIADKTRVLRAPGFWFFFVMMILAGAAEGALTFWSAALIQLRFESLPREGGWGAAMFAMGMIVGRLAGARWMSQRRIYRSLVGSVLIGAILTFVLPWVGSLSWFFVLLLLIGVGIACLWPGLQSYAVDRLQLEPTALFILLSCGGIPGFALASALIGWIGDWVGLTFGFLVIPISLLVLFGMLKVERKASWLPSTRMPEA